MMFEVSNTRGQPIVLHFPDRVLTLGPFKSAALTEVECGTPQVRNLRKRRLIAIRSQRPPPKAEQKIDVNRASVAELTELTGIGPALAKRIVEFRRAKGPFSTLEELVKVTGINDSAVARFASQAKV